MRRKKDMVMEKQYYLMVIHMKDNMKEVNDKVLEHIHSKMALNM